MTTGAGGKVYSEGEQLVFAVAEMPYALEDTAESLGWTMAMAASYSFLKVAEGQADQGLPGPIPNLNAPFTIDFRKFIWGNGNEKLDPTISGFSKSFLASSNR